MGASQSTHDLVTAVVKMEKAPISSTDAYWDELFGATFSVEELALALPPGTVRSLLSSKAINLRILLERAVGNVRNYALAFDDAHKLLPPAEELMSVPALPVAISSLHFLGRLMPFLLEPHDPETEAELASLFWTAPPPGAASEGYDSLSLGQKVMYASMAVLFKPGFSVQPLPSTTMGALIHPAGLMGITPVTKAADADDGNCCSALRVILASFSELIYFDQNTQAVQPRHQPTANRWLRWARTSSAPLAKPLFSALLNVALGEQSWYASTAVGWMPYGHMMHGGGSGGRDKYVGVALHVLLLLLDTSDKGGDDRQQNLFWLELQSLEDYPAEPKAAAAAATAATATAATAAVDESVEVAAAAAGGGDEDDEPEDFTASAVLRPPGNFAKMLAGFEAMLSQAAVASRTYLPNSVKEIVCADELLVLLWHLMGGNAGFRAYVAAHPQRIVVAVCQHICANRHEPSRIGVLHVCIFILLLLSSERVFCVSMNRPLDPAGPVPPPELGLVLGVSTCADMMVSSLYKLLCDSDPQAAGLADMGLTIICNISPYVKAYSNAAALHLLGLLDRFSKPVAAAAKAQTLAMPLPPPGDTMSRLMLIVETLDNMLQYQAEGNARITYGLVRRQAALKRLLRPPSDDAMAESNAEEGSAIAHHEWQIPLVERLTAIVLVKMR